MLTGRSIPLEFKRKQVTVVEDSGVEPITLEELKIAARIDTVEENEYLESVIKATRLTCEKWLGRTLIEKTLRLTMSLWEQPMALPKAPAISITSIKTLDDYGAGTLIDPSEYYLSENKDPGFIYTPGSAPTGGRAHMGIEVIYKAGYGPEPEDVPSPLRQAILLWSTDIYENRIPAQGASVTLALEVIPSNVKRLLSQFRVMKL